MDSRTREADKMAQRFVYDACRERYEHLIRAAQYGQWFVEALKDAGLPEKKDGATDLREVLGVILDAISNAHGLIQQAADRENIAPEMFPIEVAEMQQMHAALTKPRFPEVSCSQCGQSFGPGDHGFSHCANHAHLKGKP